MRRLLYVAFFLEVGLLLIVLPWSTFWNRNYFAVAHPLLRAVVTNDFVRGAVSGLGLVNVAAGFVELMAMFRVRERQGLSLDSHATDVPSYPHSADTQADR